MSESYMTGNSDNPLALRRVKRLEKARKLGLKIVQAVGRLDYAWGAQVYDYAWGAQVYRASVQNFHITLVIWGDGEYSLLITEDDRICLNALWDALTANFDDRVVVEDDWDRRLPEAWDKEKTTNRRPRQAS